ncbi:MAG TPA: hypothetical protein VHO70_12050 [Chitinispirillaceae bacterium]|nr:hypothetical protein [Chitinispirillaceae bacterium]
MHLSFQEKQSQARVLLSENAVTAFEEGFCIHLLSGRNTNLGNLLGSERALFYLHITYRMLLFRREHELEPLHEDLYRAVRDAQQTINGEPYLLEHYTSDINNLHEWKLITVRLEKERIKGYKDTRRTKYRYGLTDETIRFLVWLEERLQDDIEEHISDARDLLEEVAGTIRELRRFLNTLQNQNREPDENEARRILYQINKLDQLSHDVGSTLNEFNARLLGFLVCDYDIGSLRELLNSLNLYVEKYLSRIGMVRETLLPELKKINSAKSKEKIQIAKKIMDQERLSAPREFRARSESADPMEVPSILIRFYKNNGVLDVICHRINESALRVWRRMSTHLKELERKSHRIDDLRARMAELAAKPEEYIPVNWIVQLLSWGHMRGDMHQWDEHELAEPPRPKKGSWKKHRSPMLFLESAKPGEEVAMSMEQTRLNLLKEWLQSRISSGGNWKFSDGPYAELSDFQKVIELARAGILGNGKKLKSIEFTLTPLEIETVLKTDKITIRCNDMEIKSK